MSKSYLAKCKSTTCENYSNCARAKSENKAEVDYLGIKKTECDWFMEIKNEVKE